MNARLVSAIVILIAGSALASAAGVGRVVVWATVANHRGDPIPVSHLSLEMVSAADTTVRTDLVTDWEGKATANLKAGGYRLRTTTPVQIGDSSYQWNVPLTVRSKFLEVRLTRANAIVGPPPARNASDPAGPAAPREVFERLRHGVVRVESGWHSGTGFIVDGSRGVIVTSARLLGDEQSASVYFDSATRVGATLLLRDTVSALALLRVRLDHCVGCLPLPLRRAPGASRQNEPILSIGYLIDSGPRMLSGFSTSSDSVAAPLDLGRGEGGTPILDFRGEVIGIADVLEDHHEITIARVIPVSTLHSMIGRAATTAAARAVPSGRLPVMRRRVIPDPLITAIIDTTTARRAASQVGLSAGRFVVSFTTPVTRRFALGLVDNQLSGLPPAKLDGLDHLNNSVRLTLAKQFLLWEHYVRSERDALVAVEIASKVDYPLGESLLRALRAQSPSEPDPSALEFKAEIRAVRVYRNGEEVLPLRGGPAAQIRMAGGVWRKVENIPAVGYYLFPPEAFEPDERGTPPHLLVVIQDRSTPAKLFRLTVAPDIAARIWNQFVPYLKTVESQSTVWAKPNRRTMMTLQCDPQTATCVRAK